MASIESCRYYRSDLEPCQWKAGIEPGSMLCTGTAGRAGLSETPRIVQS